MRLSSSAREHVKAIADETTMGQQRAAVARKNLEDQRTNLITDTHSAHKVSLVSVALPNVST